MEGLYLVALLVVAYLIYHAWGAWNDPATRLGRQGASMNWVTSRYVEQGGARHQCLKKGDLEALIDFNRKVVHLLLPDGQKTFTDFVELENWLVEAKDVAVSKSALMSQISESTKALDSFIAEIGTWPRPQADAASQIVKAILEKSEEDLDQYFDELTAGQTKRVSETVGLLTGTKPPQ